MSNLVYQGKKVRFAGKQIKTPALHSDLVAYWKLDEIDGSALDSMGRLHGSISRAESGVVQNQEGKINQSYQFNRDSSGAIYFPMEQFYGYQSDFTFTAWVKWDDSSTGYFGILGAENQGAGFGIFKSPLYNYIYLEAVAYDYTVSYATFCPPANEWAFVVVVNKYVDATTSTQIYYVNDISTSNTKTWAYPFLEGRSTYTIGLRRPSNQTDFFRGNIDEVGIWKRALSNDEIVALYNSSAGKSFPFMNYRQSLLSNLVSYWKLDEIDGSVFDATHNIADGYVQYPAGITRNVSGKINKSYYFKAAQKGTVILPLVSALDMYGKSFSYTAWIKLDSSGASSDMAILGGETAAAGFLVDVGEYTTIGLQSIAMEGKGSYPLRISNDSSTNWHFIAVTYNYIDDYNGIITFYIDSSYYVVDGGTPYEWTYPFVSGRNVYGIGSRRTDQEQGYFNGNIDEVGIWNRVLTATEISQLYNFGAGLTYPFTYKKVYISDNFESYDISTSLNGINNWETVISDMTVDYLGGQKRICGNTWANYSCIKKTDNIGYNQWAQLTNVANSYANFIGPAVRISGSEGTTTCYKYGADGLTYTRVLEKFDNASYDASIIASSNQTVKANDIFRIEAEGSTIRCYINGVLDTSLSGGTGIFTDASFSTGSIGIWSRGANRLTYADNFAGGDL